MVEMKVATLAGGCFWGMEHFFRKEFLDKIHNIRSGYIGGEIIDPMYSEVKKGTTGHAEAIQFQFDPSVISFEDLVTYFFRIHDPTTKDRQEIDIGHQYRSVIFYHSEQQLEIAKKVKLIAQTHYPDPIVTEFISAQDLVFYTAEQYHQAYLIKNPDGECSHYVRW